MAVDDLPNEVTALKGVIADYQAEVDYLSERVRFLQAQLFGRKSEKRSDNCGQQLSMFDEAEDVASKEVAPEVTVPAHTRRKPGRRPLPEDLPRIVRTHDLSEEEKVCECGSPLTRIGEEVSEKLDIVPAKIQVIRHVRYKYACKNCQGVESEGGAVKTASLPPQIIPQGIVTPGLLAHIVVAKFADALPFYRQEAQFARLGIEISRATMAGWTIRAAEACEPLLSLLQEEIRSGPLINMDETPVQVLNEPGRANTTKSYMWLFRGGGPEHPALVFQYHPTRSGKVAKDYIGDYTGYIQTDGYFGYDALGERPGIHHLGCWAHVRRKFVDVIKATKKTKKRKRGTADEVLDHIRNLYAIEHIAKEKEMSVEEIRLLRQEKALPILKGIKKLLDERAPTTPPKGLLGKAITYALGQWGRLVRYVEDGYLRPDNNLAENAIRPFVVGRKNWLFSGHPRGANASAAMYSLIETAKANGIEPYSYLRFIFDQLPWTDTAEQYKALLPQHVDKRRLAFVA